MLSERKAAILQAVVEGYIATSEPVGSTQVVRDAGLSVSSATVRSELSALEDAGYLMQPHTSAGRIPSDKGYRYFVDSLMEPATLGRNQERKVSSFFAAAQGELERMLRDTSSFLAQLTDYASVVVAAPAEVSRVRAIHTVRLADDQAMVVVVHANTAIDRVLVPIDPVITDDQLDAAGALIAASRMNDEALTSSGDPALDALATRLWDAIERPATEAQAFVGGTSAVAGLFDAVERVQDVLLVLEKQYLVVSIIRDIIDRGLNVAIGHETGLEPLADCAIVVAPVEVDGHVTGSIGLLGPSRMHYPEAVATVALVSKQLGRRLSEGPIVMSTDHYATLGLSPQASADEIKRAYRKLARANHPDANPDDPEAERRFKEIARAYEVLSDPERQRPLRPLRHRRPPGRRVRRWRRRLRRHLRGLLRPEPLRRRAVAVPAARPRAKTSRSSSTSPSNRPSSVSRPRSISSCPSPVRPARPPARHRTAAPRPARAVVAAARCNGFANRSWVRWSPPAPVRVAWAWARSSPTRALAVAARDASPMPRPSPSRSPRVSITAHGCA